LFISRVSQAGDMASVPDWRLSDDDFVQEFRLPKKGLGALAAANPLPREDRVQFDEEAHTYTIDGATAPRSVTGLLNIYENRFDPERALSAMQNGQSWESICENFEMRGLGVTNKDFLDRWTKAGEVGRMRGHLLHFHCECLANSIPVQEPHSPDFQQAQDMFKWLLDRGMKPYRAEVNIFHVGLRCGGQPDLLLLDAHGRIVIVDWKRTKKLSMENDHATFKYPLNHLPDCSYYRYALQVNLYRYILTSEYMVTAGSMFLAVCHPDLPVPRLIEVPALDAEVNALVEHEIAQGRATAPCAMSAQFRKGTYFSQSLNTECVCACFRSDFGSLTIHLSRRPL